MESKFKLFAEIITKITAMIHKQLGPGFSEEVYQNALALELRRYEINYLKETIDDTVRYHSISDVPITYLLSSGIDSNVLVASASSQQNNINSYRVYTRQSRPLRSTIM